MKDIEGISGIVTAQVFGPDGTLKSQSIHHNLITAQGDGCIADMFLASPTKVKFDTIHSYMVLGTGWASVTTPKTQTWVFTQTGSAQGMTAGFPQLQGPFPNNVVVYQVTFPAGALSASNINEAALVNNPISGAGQCLAYAQITPAQNVTSADTFQLTWQITFLGS